MERSYASMNKCLMFCPCTSICYLLCYLGPKTQEFKEELRVFLKKKNETYTQR